MRRLWETIVGLGIPVDMLLSVVVAVGWIATLSIATGDWAGNLPGLVLMLIPLAVIWFREPISEMGGSVGFHQINGPTPAGFVGFMGWLGLIAIIVTSARHTFG